MFKTFLGGQEQDEDALNHCYSVSFSVLASAQIIKRHKNSRERNRKLPLFAYDIIIFMEYPNGLADWK